MTPTKGVKISQYASPHKALLVIDIQEDSTGITAKDSSPFKNDSEKYIASVNQIINSHQVIRNDILHYVHISNFLSHLKRFYDRPDILNHYYQ